MHTIGDLEFELLENHVFPQLKTGLKSFKISFNKQAIEGAQTQPWGASGESKTEFIRFRGNIHILER